jgi:molybdopterin/thiamine biosynthesis adenylyltransferase
MHITIVGLGGIGSSLCESLARFINYSRDLNPTILLVDGDEFEPKNFERQVFLDMGNKAEVKADELLMKFPNLQVDSYDAYINEANIAEAIQNGDIVFLCVDNHKTRMIVNNYCKNLTDVTLISGGNEFEDGNVQIYVKKGGQDITPDLCAYHPEIANPEDRLPEEMGCEELSQSAPQLYFTNLYVATLMCCAFYNVVVKEEYERSEVYFDVRTMSADAKIRILKNE